jgi:uroporphyrinogen decarboxylase
LNNRERTLAILNYQDYDRLPLVHFGFWDETLLKWAVEGHITAAEARDWEDGNAVDVAISRKLGFDYDWANTFKPATRLLPPIEERVIEVLPDGARKVLDENGAIVIEKDGATGIPTELDHMLKGRKEWEEFFLPRLQFSQERVTGASVRTPEGEIPFEADGLEYLRRGEWEKPYGLNCGSLYGVIRNWLGLVGSAYLQVDDPALFDEMIDTVGELCYRCAERALATGARFDFAHWWEDICFRSGPLINPCVFREKVGPHYRRISDLLHRHGIDLISLDCDGKIDALVPIWLENGVNIMFPIEVGVWNASIAPWREAYGPELRGVGGMDKRVFAQDYAAIDAEIERLKPLVDLGGYIPCPDHRIAPDGKWENVQYYCGRMREVFG